MSSETLSKDDSFIIKPLIESSDNIKMIEAKIKISPSHWIKNNSDLVNSLLLADGAILLRNFAIDSISEFNRFSQEYLPELQAYTYRSTPRKTIGGKIYTATEYPADRCIRMHNENSYSLNWPQKIVFNCVIAASEGGNTPIADSREVYKLLDPEVIKRFSEGIKYVRNYYSGIDLSWEEVFQTSDKQEVVKYCTEHNLEYLWSNNTYNDGPELTTTQICQATLKHPITGQDVWFNQAHLFHSSSLDTEIQNNLLEIIGKECFPRNCFYADGSDIPKEVINHINEAYVKVKKVFNWQRGDILILDNILMAHGRSSYKGERKIAVAMG